MADPWENDPDNLLEVSFRHDHRCMERAAAVVAAALEQIGQGFPANARADARRRARSARLSRAWPAGFGVVELAVSEYLTREAQPRVVVGVADVIAGADDLARQASALQARIGAMHAALDHAEASQQGAEVGDALAMASGHAADAFLAARAALVALEVAARHVPFETRGRGGALARLRVPNEVALFRKLRALWQVSGLGDRAGDDGDGLDVFLFNALRAADPTKVSRARWFEKLREREASYKSTENTPPK